MFPEKNERKKYNKLNIWKKSWCKLEKSFTCDVNLIVEFDTHILPSPLHDTWFIHDTHNHEDNDEEEVEVGKKQEQNELVGSGEVSVSSSSGDLESSCDIDTAGWPSWAKKAVKTNKKTNQFARRWDATLVDPIIVKNIAVSCECAVLSLKLVNVNVILLFQSSYTLCDLGWINIDWQVSE